MSMYRSWLVVLHVEDDPRILLASACPDPATPSGAAEPVFIYEKSLPLSPLGFAGYYHDSESGLNYAWNRFQSPDTGRWLTRDPAGFVDGPNLYAYVHNDPVNGVDVWGLADPTKYGPIASPDGQLAEGKIGTTDRGTKYEEEPPKHLTHIGEGPEPHYPLWVSYAVWALRDAIKYNIDNPGWWTTLPDCPCKNPGRVGGDGWASEGIKDYAPYHPGATECFRSYPTPANGLKAGGPGQQCCYDACGALITSGSAAGTPDRVGAAESESAAGDLEPSWWHYDWLYLAQHYVLDVKPLNDLRGWGLYNQFWPPNTGGCPANHVEVPGYRFREP